MVIIIDALRYDFTVPHNETEHYLNALTVLHETSQSQPQNAFLRPFIADPPTTTLTRLKGLTTGTLPTFVDAGSNFAGTAIDEDNLVAQLKDAGKTIVHLGDDTWHSLFPGYFDPNLTKSYDSFNVWDLHTVDNGVIEHLLPLLKIPERWDVIFGHFLGVDHAGHRYGPDHPAMAAKLRQMDEVLRQVIEQLSDDTLLVVMGDHGMDSKGDHGGESDDEIEAALWMYSRKGVFGRTDPGHIQPPKTAKIRPVNQIDLVPTLSLLLGLPIPFNNLGWPIEEAFVGADGQHFEHLSAAYALSGAQIHEYQEKYASVRGSDTNAMILPEAAWQASLTKWDKPLPNKKADQNHWLEISQLFSAYQKEHLKVCKSLWARFDLASMGMGILVLGFALLALIHFASSAAGDRLKIIPVVLRQAFPAAVLGIVLGRMVGFTALELPSLDLSLLGGSLGSLAGYAIAVGSQSLSIPLPTSLWSWASVVFTLSQSVGFASNSFTIWEDEILLFFLSTFGVLALLSSLRQRNPMGQVLGSYHSILFLFLSRISSLSRLCREEQMPICRSTFYASATSSTSAIWQLFIPYVVATLLPSILKSYYSGTRSYEGISAFWIGFCFRLGLLGTAVYWTIDAADNGEWFASISPTTLSGMKIHLAQILLGLAFIAGAVIFIWAPLCIQVLQSTTSEPTKSIIIFGHANVHGSRYALLYIAWHLGITIVSKPMANGSLAVMGWQLFSLLEILDINGLTPTLTQTTPSIASTMVALIASFYYFKTGHTATLSSIQWDVAFLSQSTIRYPWSPLLVMLNHFASFILAAVFIPLVALWKQPAPGNKRPLSSVLNDICSALADFIVYFAVESLATTMWAGHLRRHLMLYRIFNPRFLMGAAVLLIVDVIGIFVGLMFGIWCNIGSVAEVFGWN